VDFLITLNYICPHQKRMLDGTTYASQLCDSVKNQAVNMRDFLFRKLLCSPGEHQEHVDYKAPLDCRFR